MPRAGDAFLNGALPLTHNPLDRVDYQTLAGKFDLDAFIAQLEQFIDDYLFPIIEELTGLDLSALKPFLDELFDIVHLLQTALSALTSGDPAQLFAFFTELADLDILQSFPNLILGLLSGAQGVNVLGLFGQLPTNLFGLIPASSISGANPNLLSNGGFDGSISMQGGGLWDWDSTTGHTTNGSAKTTANSTLKALVSNAVPVDVGQVLSPSVWTKGSSYTGSGTPIRLAVRTYLAGVAVGTTNIQSIAGPSGTWTQLSGSYTVPAGVDSVAIRLVVDTTATGGTIWFDDATLSKPGNGPFDGILDLFNLSSLDDLFSLNPVTIWTAIINLFLKPSNLLATLTGGILPDSQRPQMLQDAVDNIFDAWNTGVSGSTTGNPISNLFNAVFGINRTGTGAVSQNVVQDSQIGTLLSGGTTPLFDTFDGASGSSLGSNWTQTYSGSGGGSYGLSGSGAAKWNTSGASARRSQNRYTFDTFDTDTQSVSVTLSANLGVSTIGSHPQVLLRGRVDATDAYAIEAQMQCTSVEIGYYVSGSYTRIGTAFGISGNTSGTWQLKIGTVSSTREYVLLHNNVTVLTRTESGTTSQLGASYRYAGFSAQAGVQWLGGLLFFQMAPPEVEAFGANDRLPAL
jgi:hypothetical protein